MSHEADKFQEVLSEIASYEDGRIPVPRLAEILGVKKSTLNSRFRREQAVTMLESRTSYVPLDIAFGIAEKHKYAILGYPTIDDVSKVTGIKYGTIKARCEHGING